MDPITGLAALAGVTLASIAGLRLTKKQEEGFDALPDRDTGYSESVGESQSRYNMFSGMVNPITNSIIPVGSPQGVVQEQKDRVNAALGNYSAEFSPDSSQTVVLKKFENQFKPRADSSKSLYAAARFCRSAGNQTTPFTVYNSDGSVRTQGAVSPDGYWKFDEVCGICLTDGVDEEGNRFRKPTGLLVEPSQRQDAYDEQEKNSWSYPRVAPSIGACTGAPDGPVFATNAKDLSRYGARQRCLHNKTLGGTDNCAVCYDTDTYSSLPPDTEINELEVSLSGIAKVRVYLGNKEILNSTMKVTDQGGFKAGGVLTGAKEGDVFRIDLEPLSEQDPNVIVWGTISARNPRGGLFGFPLNLIMTVDDETGSTPNKAGGFETDSATGLELAKMRPSRGKTKMRLRGTIPFTFVSSTEFAAMDCLDGPFQAQSASLSAFATDQPCYARGSAPGRYNDACLRARILDAGCTNAGTLYQNPSVLNTKDGAAQTLTQIYTTLQTIADNDMVDPEMTKQCSGRTIQTPCDPFILRAGSLKFGDALSGANASLKTQAQQCLSFLYNNKGASELARPPRVGPSYTNPALYRNNRKDSKNLYCLPDGSLNPDANPAGRDALVRAADQGYAGKIGVDGIKAYLSDMLTMAIDTSRNANTDPERKAAIVSCFGKDLKALPAQVTGTPTIIQNACGVVARFVRVLPSQFVSDSFIEISQIAVIDKTGANVAAGKSTTGTSPAWPSSGAFGSHAASNAVDGQLYTKERNFYHSASPGGTSQFLLDLGNPTDVTKVILWSRGDNARTSHHRKNGMRLQLLDGNQAVLTEKLLNSSLREEVVYQQAGADSACRSTLPDATPLTLPAGFSGGLYVRFFEITDANPDVVPGNRGWGRRIGSAAPYGALRFTDGTLAQFDKCGLVAKGYYIATGAETLYLATESDDGVYIEFNGRQVLRNWTIHAPTRDVATPIQITGAGVYPFEVRFYEWGGGALLNLFYRINDEATWRTDLTARFAYKPAEVQQEDADFQARILAQQQAAAAAAALASQGLTRLTITFPDGRQIRNDNGTLRLNRGTPITFDISRRGDVYKSTSGYLALQQTGTQSFLRHAGLVAYVHPFAPNNGDFGWQIVPQGSGYLLRNEFAFTGSGWIGFGQPSFASYLGYDAGTDTLRLMSYTQPSTWIAWRFSPIPAISAVVTQQTAIIFGPWIGPRGNGEIPSTNTFTLSDGTKVYAGYEAPYTKMVTQGGVAKYFVGAPTSFNAASWNGYASAGTNYRLKFV